MEPSTNAPFVSLIVPVRNERARIEACVTSLLEQDYPDDRLEILVLDGMSDDGTPSLVREVADGDQRVRVIENPDQTMPSGLNRGIEASTAEVIGVVSGHSVVPSDYVTRAVASLHATGAWSVGAGIERVSTSGVQRAIAAATGSSIGVGDARHNYADSPGWVESVFPGMWPRFVFETIGTFDPAMISNEDNELSLRIRLAGGRIWYDPSIRVRYWPRESLAGLFTQYRRYARGRVAVYRKHRSGLDWRHFLPPLLVTWIVAGPLMGLVDPTGYLIWAAGLVAYVAVVAVGSMRAARGANTLLVMAAVAVMHVAYGVGLFQGLADGMRGSTRR